jgi:hypothetical protein
MTFRIPVSAQMEWCLSESNTEHTKCFAPYSCRYQHVTCSGDPDAEVRSSGTVQCRIAPFRWTWPPDKDLPVVVCCYKYQHNDHGITVYGYHTSTHSAQVVTSFYHKTDILERTKPCPNGTVGVKLSIPSHLLPRLRMSGTYLHFSSILRGVTYLHFPRRLHSVYRQLCLLHLPKSWPDCKPNNKNKIYIK